MIKRSPIFGLMFWLMLFAVMLAEPAQAETLINSASRVRRNEQLLTLSQREKFSTSAATLLAQESNSVEVVKVTGVKLNSTQQELEVILETTGSDQLQPVTRSEGNNFIADIPNAQLVLPSGDKFRQENPASGITALSVTNIDANTIRVTVTGEASQPKVELFDSNRGLIFGVAITALSVQPQQKPEAPQEESTAQQDEPIELVVTGEQDRYYVPDASVGTKTDTPLRDIPQSIHVVPQQVLEDQQATNLSEALRNIAGVSQGGNSSTRGFFAIPTIRGFNGINDILTNGLRDPSNAPLGFNTATIERIEVLKGPASVLYGQGSIGGVVNLITRQPLAEPYYSVEASAGSFNFYSGVIDLSGPLNDSKTVLYRMIGSALTTESFIDFFERQEYIIAPTLTLNISDRTKLTLAAEYVDRPQSDGQVGLPAVGTVLPNPNGELPRDRNLAEPSARDDVRAIRGGYDFEHRLSENWQLRSAFKITDYRRDVRDRQSPLGLNPDNRTLRRGYVDGFQEDDYLNFDNYVVGNFATGSIKHQLVTGFNYTRREFRTEIDFAPAAPLDIFNPIFNQPLTGELTKDEDYEFANNAYGIYIQDQITFAENLKFLVGGRFDITNWRNKDFLSGDSVSQQKESFSPRVGIVYQPIRAISLYASYSQSFLPPQNQAFEEISEPERGTQYEVGIKADLSERIAATLAFYDLTRSNVSTSDPNNPLRSIQVGEQRSRGIEFDLTGEILPGWNIIASYAFTDTEITEDNTFPVGNQLNNVPKHAASLWTTYEIKSGSLQGLGFGVGVFYVGDRQGDLANTFELPSYVRTDAAIFYRQDRFRAAVNFKNLFDVDYFDSALNRNNVYRGDPFVVQGTVSWQF